METIQEEEEKEEESDASKSSEVEEDSDSDEDLTMGDLKRKDDEKQRKKGKKPTKSGITDSEEKLLEDEEDQDAAADKAKPDSDSEDEYLELHPPEKELPQVRKTEKLVIPMTRQVRPGVPARDRPGRAPPHPRQEQLEDASSNANK